MASSKLLCANTSCRESRIINLCLDPLKSKVIVIIILVETC